MVKVEVGDNKEADTKIIYKSRCLGSAFVILHSMKNTKFSIAVVLINPNNSDEILAVKRPHGDNSLPGVWGLPAVTVEEGELSEAAVKRLGVEKLATQIQAESYIGIQYDERADYGIILMDIRATLVGDEPAVENAQTSKTKYVAQKWTSDLSIFTEAAAKGSLCVRILVESKDVSREYVPV